MSEDFNADFRIHILFFKQNLIKDPQRLKEG